MNTPTTVERRYLGRRLQLPRTRLTLAKPMSFRPRVSVVVPCYNYGHYLPQAIGSILNQQGVDLEVIIVDDHSTDGSEGIAAQLAAEHPEVRLIRNKINMRHIATYNIGLAEATGDYVVLLSADDMLADGSLARATALMECYPNVGLVYGECSDFSDVPVPVTPARTWTVWSGTHWLRAVAHRGDNVVVNPEVVMRGSVLRELGGYHPGFPQAADFLLWLEAATVSDIGRVNGVQGHYRNHADQMHLTDFAGTLTDMRARANLFRAFFGENGRGSAMPGANRMLRAALRSTAIEAAWSALLAGSAEQQDTGSRDSFRDFAISQWPAIRGTVLWRELERTERGEKRRIPDVAINLAYRAKWVMKWRMWRRWGLSW